MKVALMITCMGDSLRPDVGKATARLLRRLGHEVVFPLEQTCCGQPFHNSGFADMARAQARYTINVFREDVPVVTPSGSCAAMVKIEYPHLLKDDDAWSARAKALADRTFELTDFLVNRVKTTDVGARFEGKVAFHYACHLRMLGVANEPETLIRQVQGATYVPLDLVEQCCGFGGSFSVRYPEISSAMVGSKVDCLERTEADAVTSTDLGCLTNIEGASRRRAKPLRFLHIAELLESQ
ncbi:MAG: (Fe-S)-binding protein [Planctomycetales bacterium]